MRIKTRLKLNSLITLIALILVIVPLSQSYREMSLGNRDARLVGEMRKVNLEKQLAADEYCRIGEERAKVQWSSKTDTFRSLLESARERLTTPAQKDLLEEIGKSFEATVVIFSRIVQARNEGATIDATACPGEEEQIAGLALKPYILAEDLARLEELIGETADAARDWTILLMALLIVVGFIVTVGNSALLNRVLAIRLAELREGAWMIGSGNLDHRLDVTGNDELSDLARMTNEMAANLQESFTSVENLERETMARKEVEKALRENEDRFSMALEVGNAGVWEWNRNRDEVYLDARFHAMLGYTPGELPNTLQEWLPYHHPEEIPVWMSKAEAYLRGDSPIYESEHRIRNKAGTWSWVFTRGRLVSLSATGSSEQFIGIAINITERKRAERALEESEAKMRGILDNIGIGVALISPGMEIIELNHRMREWFPAIDPAKRPLCYRAFNDPPREVVCDYCPTCKTLRDGLVHEATTKTPQAGAIRNYRIITSPVLNAQGEVTAVIEMVDDITEKLTLESELRQALKMEAVGRLAGGVAHDFNNMLGVIIGYTELAMSQMDSAQPLFAHLREIRKAAGRSSDLTRQLLAFARKQTVAPRVLDLNETVEGMLKMLRRLIGENIDLAWQPGVGVWPVKVDPSQVDQILANLCVNAGDAIAGVGKVTIETHPVTFDEAYCADHPGVVPGEYVLLAVSDDGCGMDMETLDRLFEPFFTTKEMGKGTGLGLATVYGIVRQNDGFINVYSEPEHGTTFKIYLPRHAAKTEQVRTESPEAPAALGHETILLVEDEPAMLEIGRQMLERLGYRVLAASTPGEAIRVANEHADEIHLLITDVIMPEMNGRDLAKNLIVLYPGISRLFMSGYTGNVIAHHGVLDEGIHFIQKPFSMRVLAAKVREALDSQ